MTKHIKEKIEKKCMSNLVSCFCWMEKGHKGLHRCRCGGSWDNKFIPHSLPIGLPLFPSTKEELKILNKKSGATVITRPFN